MADPLRRTLSKLRGKKSKRGKGAEGISAAPEEEAQMPTQHPLANQNNNNYREVLWAGEDCRWMCSADMTRERLCKPGGDRCPCTACQAAMNKPQGLGWTVDGWRTQPGAGQGCEYSGFRDSGTAVGHEDLSVTRAPHTCGTPRTRALSPAPGHAQLCSHSKVATFQTLSVDSAQSPDQAFQEGKLVISRQNGFARVQHCPQQKWQQARDIVSELATAHPGQARHLYASLQQTYRSSLQSQHSLDSEEDDYYDNDCLPFYEPPELSSVQGGQYAPSAGESARNGEPSGKGSVGVSQETDRLRSQLQEAYYLLIHAMHDMPVERRSPLPSSTPSQDSICTQSSPRAPESEHCSSGEASPQQVSDTESAAPASGAFLPRRHQWSKSEETLGKETALPSLHRSLSDSGIQYGPLPPRLRDRQECGGGPDSEEEDSQSPAAEEQAVRWGRAAGGAGHPSRVDKEWLGGLGDPDHSASGMGSRPDGPLRASGVTVRKMQKWMYKGRLLSLEMKERIIGGSLRPGGLGPRDEGRGGGMVPGSAPSDRRQRTDLIENVYTSSVLREDLKVAEVNEQRQQKNSITVSKKRNWLQQSTQSPPPNDGSDFFDNLPGHVAHPPVALCSESPNLPIASRSHSDLQSPVRPQASITTTAHGAISGPGTLSKCTWNLSEENDADDEGEIWYNPIPEDDEPDLLRGHCTSGVNTAKSDVQLISLRKKVSGRDLVKGPGHAAGRPSPSECAGDSQTAPSSEINLKDSSHSSEHHLQLHKQRSLYKRPARLNADDLQPYKSSETDPGNKASIPEFSPPSSPSPVKKGGPMNWSFPDKIKSPRTVRKLSMKMKKLPELSRKLSVKGGSSHTSYDNSSSSPKGNCQSSKHPSSLASGNTAAASRNVISRYHLDTSVSSQHSCKKKTTGNSKSSSKGGYLSDGDSPELLTKSGKHAPENRANKGKEALQSNNNKSDIDIDAFRHYNFSDQPKCSHYISGLMSVHFYGAEDLKPPRIDTKDVFCAIQVDSVNKARTALLTCRTAFLDMDHTFNIDLENAQHLKLVVFSWDPAPRKNRVCCHGTVVLPSLFRVTKMHHLAVKLEPRGLIYVKITLMDQRENSFNSSGVNREPVMFGVEARKVVEMENAGLMVPLLMEKCIEEIEKRGCQVVGLYRLCGSAAVKKELREAFERDSKSVVLCENQYPDINVITGVLKDYLRELPSPLITKQLYEAVLSAMARKPLKITGNGNETETNDLKNTVGLLDCLPDVEKATLKMLLDHLKRVASHHEVNKMTCQNLAVCFGPVLLSQRQETSHHNNRVFTDSEELASALDFKKHIEVLHYLLQMWPVQNSTVKESMYTSTSPEQQPYLRRKKQRPQVLNLNNSEMAGIRRPRPVRLDSPSSNRYAGDWSSCGENYFLNVKENLNEADYDDVPSEDIESGEDIIRTDKPQNVTEDQTSVLKEHPLTAFMAIQKMDPSLDPRVDLQDLQESIDNLIGNLERELNKNKLTISY
ncbi:hypothetical protein NDU88_003185 [Pleurodeles waltl]|uniref:Rho GTPase-activating protein SYDE2 n=1 Tax=Pleurodeles waltl TaxID=8319 RepID=A0AAV7T426_PLEWA|nr:hypothetical protein NDU88_003185 [Pleurodeles waltl]